VGAKYVAGYNHSILVTELAGIDLCDPASQG